MGKLRSESEFPKDHFSKMPSHRLGNAITIDTTITPEQHIEEMLRKRLTWGKDRYTECNTEVERQALLIEQRQKTEQEQRAIRDKELYDAQHQPLDNFIRAYNSKDPTTLAEYFRQETTEALYTILTELEGKERHYDSIFRRGGNVYHAIQTLRHELSMHAYESRTGLLTKIKEKLK